MWLLRGGGAPLRRLLAAALCGAMCSGAGRFELARASLADCEGLARLAAGVLPWGAGVAAFADEVRRRDARVWRVCRKGRVCAGVVARETGGEVDLLWLAVEPGARRHGLAGRLVGAVLAWARESGGRVRLEVRRSNAAALALYRRHGFVVVGRRPRYYGDGEDAVLLDFAGYGEGPT